MSDMKSVKSKLSGFAIEGLSSLARAVWEHIAGPTDKTRLEKLINNFVEEAQAARHPDSLIEQFLESAGRMVVAGADGGIPEITRENFKLSSIAKLIGVNKHALRPRQLLSAIDSLQAYALSSDHQSDGIFTTDGRAHLILAITAMVSGAFAIKDTDKKIKWLELTQLFLRRIVASGFVQTRDLSGVIGQQRRTFFDELINLKKVINVTIADLTEKELFRPALAEYIENMDVQITGALFDAGAVMGMFWKTEHSNMANGRPRVKDLEPPTLIGRFTDAMGFTLSPHQDQKEIKKKAYMPQSKTQAYIDWIIAWSSTPDAVPDEKTSAARPFPLPRGYKFPEDDKWSGNNLRRKNAQFLSAFENLVNKKYLQLDKDGNILLYARQKERGAPRIPILKGIIPMGLDTSFLYLMNKESATPEADQEAFRENILKAEVHKARTMNAISGLIELCDCTQDFLDNHGSVKASIFLQNLFPSMIILIEAATREHSALREVLEKIEEANPQISGRVANGMGFVQNIAENLKAMKACAEKGKQALRIKLEQVSVGKISIATQLEAINTSLENCHGLFLMSGMLQGKESDDFHRQLKLLRGEIEQAKVLDTQDQAMARSVLENPDGILGVSGLQAGLHAVATASSSSSSSAYKPSPSASSSAAIVSSLSLPKSLREPTSSVSSSSVRLPLLGGASQSSGSSDSLHQSPFDVAPLVGSSKSDLSGGQDLGQGFVTDSLHSSPFGAKNLRLPASISPSTSASSSPGLSSSSSSSSAIVSTLSKGATDSLPSVSSSSSSAQTVVSQLDDPKSVDSAEMTRSAADTKAAGQGSATDAKTTGHAISLDQLILISPDPISTLLNLAAEKEDEGIVAAEKVKLYEGFITAIMGSDKYDEIINSPAIFRFGMKVCNEFPQTYRTVLARFPLPISKIIFGIKEGKKFIFKCKKEDWKKFSLYVSSEIFSRFLQTWHGEDEMGTQAQVRLHQVGDSEFFKMNVVYLPNNYMYVYGGKDGSVKDNWKGDPGPQGYFNFTPHNEGEYFTIATKAWPKAKLYIADDVFGIVRSREVNAGDQAHIGINLHEDLLRQEAEEAPAEGNIEMARIR